MAVTERQGVLRLAIQATFTRTELMEASSLSTPKSGRKPLLGCSG